MKRGCESLGLAQCARCALRHSLKDEWRPVPSEFNTRANSKPARITVLSDYCSKQEHDEGRPLVGTNGNWFMRWWADATGMSRLDVNLVNVIACMVPGNELKLFRARLKRKNMKRIANGLEPLLDPAEACLPRLQDDLRGAKYIVATGEVASKLLCGQHKFSSIRGAPFIVTWAKEARRVLPTMLAMRAVKDRNWERVFKSDLRKAVRHFKGELRWKDCENVIINPPLGWLDTWRKTLNEKYSHVEIEHDAETTRGSNMLLCDLRMWGFRHAETDTAVIYVFQSVEGEHQRYLTGDNLEGMVALRHHAQHDEYVQEIARLFSDPQVMKVGHNSGYFDRIMAEKFFGVTPRPEYDNILGHKAAESELPHGLGFVSSLYTDAPAWKAEHTAITARTDRELIDYNVVDLINTGGTKRAIQKKGRKRGQIPVYKIDRKLQDLAVEMKCIGIRVDESRRVEHVKRCLDSRNSAFAECMRVAEDTNINAPQQVARLLYDHWQLPVTRLTDTGWPATDAAMLRELECSVHTDADQKSWLRHCRLAKRADKILGTYLHKLRPGGGVVIAGEASPLAWLGIKYKHCNFLYPDYNTDVVITGRYSSSGPNFQNWPSWLLDMFVPAPGCVFVGADQEQLELRFAAALMHCLMYLDAFNNRTIDPHNLTAELMFGEQIWELEGAPKDKTKKGTGKFKKVRNTAKTLGFAALYKAAVPRILEIMQRYEDDDGTIIYRDMNIKRVTALRNNWLHKAPEIAQWWAATLNACQRNGYIEEPIFGRRRYFASMDPNAIINFKVQAGGFAVVAKAMMDMRKIMGPPDLGAKHGLCFQLHDALTYQVPEARADETVSALQNAMTRKELDVQFEAFAEVGYSLLEVK